MKTRRILAITALILFSFAVSCVKDLEEEGIYTTTQYIGTVVEKSTMHPIEGVQVQVTDGTHVHASATTDSRGAFSLRDIDFEEVSKDYYLWLDGSALGLPSAQEELRGLGRKIFDYKALILYDKTNVELLPVVNTDSILDVLALSAKVKGTVVSDGNHEVTERGVCFATHQTPTLEDSVIAAGSGLGSYTCALTGLTKATTYYVRTYATNSIGTVFGAQKIISTKSGEAEVSTMPATDVKSTSAVVGGKIDSDGGDAITERGICWGTLENPSLSGDHTSDGADTGAFSHTLQNLAIGTTYYYRAYATNSCGTTYGVQKSFTTTSGLPVLTTSSASNITATSAKCGGNITDNGGFPVTARGICWNTLGNPDISDDYTSNGTGNGTFNGNITNLEPGITYHVRAYATNQTGTAYGNEVTFTTLSGNISLTTTVVSNITSSTATSGGNITDNGGFPVTARGICWNTLGNPDINDNHTTNGSGNGSFTGNMTNLSVGTTYHVRAYATNSRGTSYGNELIFSTLSGNIAMILDTVGNLTINSATCGATITNDGGASISARGLCWSTNQYPTVNNTHNTCGSGMGSFRGSMTELSHNTTYYVRAYATNSVGTSYSAQASFTTPSGVLIVNTPTASNISENSVTLQGGSINTTDCQVALQHGGRPTEVGVCYGTTHNPTVSSPHILHTVIPSDNLSSRMVNQTVSGLTPGTTYYARSYATNAIGTFYSSEYTFTTTQVNLVFTLQNPSTVTGTAATFSANVSYSGGTSGVSVTERGFCWSTTTNPTISNSHEIVGSGYGEFSRRVTGLSTNTTYYVRAYAIKAGVPQYSAQKSFTTTTGTTVSLSVYTPGENNISGYVSFSTEIPISEVGICWGHNSNPTTSDNSMILGTGANASSYSFNITNLAVGGGPYYLRAYVRRSDGIIYSSQVQKYLAYDQLATFSYNGHTYKVGEVSPSSLPWASANTYCVNYNCGGYTDWRMPTKEELLVMSQSGCLSSSSYNTYYWSSTAYGNNEHYVISGTGAEYHHDSQQYNNRVHPVRIDQ